MEKLDRLGRLSDRFNPLLVREIRQSFRSRIFTGVIILSSILCGCAVVAGIIIATNSNFIGFQIYAIIYMTLWFICCVAVPASALNRFRTERGRGDYELFIITGISPEKIVLGKLQSSVAQALLLITMSAPFLMSCYLMRGISILQIGGGILIVLCFTVILTQVGILFSSLPVSKAFMILVSLPFYGLLFSLIFGGGTVLNFFSRPGDLKEPLTVIFILSIFYFYLSYLCSVALLDTYRKNKTVKIRVFLLVSLLIAAIGIGIMREHLIFSSDLTEVFFYTLFSVSVFLAALMIPSIQESTLGIQDISAKKNLWCLWKIPFGKGLESYYVWFGILMLLISLSEKYLLTNQYYFITVTGFAIFVWCLLSNLVFLFILRKKRGIVASAFGVVIPSIVSFFIGAVGMSSNNDNILDFALFLCPITTFQAINKLALGETAITFLIILELIIILYGFIRYLIALHTFRKRTVKEGV